VVKGNIANLATGQGKQTSVNPATTASNVSQISIKSHAMEDKKHQHAQAVHPTLLRWLVRQKSQIAHAMLTTLEMPVDPARNVA